MRFMQHKTEARWFYRFVSIGYDRYINPLFWTEEMRDASLELAHLDRPDLEVADVGAGTGFCTTGIIKQVAPGKVRMVDQSPHQLAKAGRKPVLAEVRKDLGDAEAIPLETDSVDRYVSSGSIEYWPDPQRAICEAYRVTKPGGRALIVGPLRRTHPVARTLSDTWMLFPEGEEYTQWFRAAGFTEIEEVHVAPDWWREEWDPYAVAIAGVKPSPGDSPLAPELLPLTVAGQEDAPPVPLRVARFALGSAAGALFIPIAAFFTAVDKVRPG